MAPAEVVTELSLTRFAQCYALNHGSSWWGARESHGTVSMASCATAPSAYCGFAWSRYLLRWSVHQLIRLDLDPGNVGAEPKGGMSIPALQSFERALHEDQWLVKELTDSEQAAHEALSQIRAARLRACRDLGYP